MQQQEKGCFVKHFLLFWLTISTLTQMNSLWVMWAEEPLVSSSALEPLYRANLMYSLPVLSNQQQIFINLHLQGGWITCRWSSYLSTSVQSERNAYSSAGGLCVDGQERRSEVSSSTWTQGTVSSQSRTGTFHPAVTSGLTARHHQSVTHSIVVSSRIPVMGMP